MVWACVLRSLCNFKFDLLAFAILVGEAFDLFFALGAAALKLSDPLLYARSAVGMLTAVKARI